MDTETTGSIAVGSAIGAFIATLGIFAVVIGIAWYIIQVVAYWKIFTKAGKPGWHSLIPVLNEWDKTDLSWSRTMAWVLLALMILSSILSGASGRPVNAEGEASGSGFPGMLSVIVTVGLVIISLISEYKLAKAFGKGFGFFLGLVFLNPIFKVILGFDGSQYLGRQE